MDAQAAILKARDHACTGCIGQARFGPGPSSCSELDKPRLDGLEGVFIHEDLAPMGQLRHGHDSVEDSPIILHCLRGLIHLQTSLV